MNNIQTIQDATRKAKELSNVELINLMHKEYLAMDIPLDSLFGILHDVLVDRFIELAPDVEDSESGSDLVQDTFPEYIE